MSAAEDCKSLHPSSILGQASNNLKGNQLIEADPNRNETGADGAVRDSDPRPNPEVGSVGVPARRARVPADGSGYVYFIQADELGYIKIGWAGDPFSRLATLQIGCPDELLLLGVIPAKDAKQEEGFLHHQFDELRVRGEWFRPEPALMSYIQAKADLWVRERRAEAPLPPPPPEPPPVASEAGRRVRPALRRYLRYYVANAPYSITAAAI